MKAPKHTARRTPKVKDESKTKVIFRYWFPPYDGLKWNPEWHWGEKKRAEQKARQEDSGEVIALFPEIATDMADAGLCQSYIHVGQHGSADFHWIIQTSVPARPDEYKELKKELEKLCGYDLEVVTRCTPQMQRTRHNEFESIKKIG